MSTFERFKDTIRGLYQTIASGKKISGTQCTKKYLTKELLEEFQQQEIITEEDKNLLTEIIDLDEKDISRGNSVKAKHIIINKIKPKIGEYIQEEQSKIADELGDLNLPTVGDILKEVRKNKLPVEITGGQPIKNMKPITEDEQPKKDESKINEETKQAEVKKEDTSTDIPDSSYYEEDDRVSCIVDAVMQQSGEYHTKEILSKSQKIMLNHLRTKLYSRENIEVLTNQKLSSFVELHVGDTDTNVDFVVCDKKSFKIVCVITLAEEIEIDFTAKLLNSLGIKRYVVRNRNDILDVQGIRAVEEEINNYYAPRCAKCGLPMRQKESLKTKHRFYACIDNQYCRYTIDMGDGD